MVTITEIPEGEIDKLIEELGKKVKDGIKIVMDRKEDYPELDGLTTLNIARYLISIIAQEQIYYKQIKTMDKAVYNILTVETAFL